jgi:fructose-1,6-bisphosphatase I
MDTAISLANTSPTTNMPSTDQDATIEKIRQTLWSASVELQEVFRNAPLEHHGKTEHANESGDQISHMDHLADEIFMRHLAANPRVRCVVSEEQTRPVTFPDHDADGFCVVLDPLDGSQNICPGLPVGPIFGLFPTPEPTVGREMVAAGYALLSSRDIFVWADRLGASSEPLGQNARNKNMEPPQDDPAHDDDEAPEHTRHYFRVPSKGSFYAINEGNSAKWSSKVVVDLVGALKLEGRSIRWMASMVGDVHRVLMEGGVFLYPTDTSRPQGRLRKLYECFPMAFVCEKSGGHAVVPETCTPILDLPVHMGDPHERLSCLLSGEHEGQAYFEKFKSHAMAATRQQHAFGDYYVF